MKNKQFLYLSLAQVALIIIISYSGLYNPATYRQETPQWYAQCIGQDILNLFLVAPLLVVSGIFSYRNNKVFLFLFGGLSIYNAYNFFIYCFAVHYNFLFLPYCLALGMSIYSLVYFTAILSQKKAGNWFNEKTPVKLAGIFLFAVSAIFYALWLSLNIPAALHDTIPADIVQNKLFTNPIHVLDISMYLPCAMIAAILLIKRKPLGYILAPVLLIFCVLMAITIAVLALVMKQKGVNSDISIFWIMLLVAFAGISILYLLFSNIAKENQLAGFIEE